MLPWSPDKPPSCGITQLKNMYEKVAAALEGSGYLNQPINTLQISYELTHYIQKAIAKSKSWTDNQTNAIRSIVTHFQEETLSYDVLERIARTVAGWKNEIEAGYPYRVWTPAMGPVWATIFIEDVRPALSKDKARFTCTLWSLSGPTVNFVWHKIFPASFCKKIIYEAGGVRSETYYPEDAGGLWITATVVMRNSFMNYDLIHASSTQKDHNKNMLLARKRLCQMDKYKNPSRECFPCEFGRDKCQFARQNKTMIINKCINQYPFPHTGAIQLRGLCKECIKNHSGYYLIKKDEKQLC